MHHPGTARSICVGRGATSPRGPAASLQRPTYHCTNICMCYICGRRTHQCRWRTSSCRLTSRSSDTSRNTIVAAKPKYHRGHAPAADQWVFDIVDTLTTPGVGYMELVPDRRAVTLIPIIQRVVLPSSIIHSDQWAAYQSLIHNCHFLLTGVETWRPSDHHC